MRVNPDGTVDASPGEDPTPLQPVIPTRGPGQQLKSKGICHSWWAFGKCEKGEQCSYRHDGVPGAGKEVYAKQQAERAGQGGKPWERGGANGQRQQQQQQAPDEANQGAAAQAAQDARPQQTQQR